jgi:hypothetical protein
MLNKVDNLKEILEKHLKWLRNEYGGERANLRGSDLSYSDLRGSNLSNSDLSYSNLRGSDLREAKNFDIAKWQPDLYILRQQPKGTKLYAYKFLNKDLTSPFQHFQYEIGKTYKCTNFDSDELHECGEGLNLATLSWCKRKRENDGQVIVQCSFFARDIVAVPIATDGKFRVKKMTIEKIVKERNKNV